MNTSRKLAVLISLMLISACRKQPYVAPESPLPANTVLLSQMMRELSAQPGAVEKLLAELDPGKSSSKRGPAVLTPKLMEELRKRVLGKDWSGLDRFPGWTMSAVTPTVDAIVQLAGKPQASYLDVGPYAIDRAETVSLDTPSTLPGFTTQGAVTDLGDGITRGDGPNDLASEHAESQRLADVLNRLAANKLEGAKLVTVSLPQPPAKGPYLTNIEATRKLVANTPEELMAALDCDSHSGSVYCGKVTVTDSRYFANFAHLHYKGQDVMAPFWLNSEIVVPNSGDRPLLVPVVHAELEWHVRGPKINADVSYYFGDDGKSEWRTMDTLDQAWVLRRDAHTYTGADAVEVTRLTTLLTVAYMHQHQARPSLPFGGYFALGVCQDGVAAIEQKMTGKTTLYPNTVDSSLFDDPRDAEVNSLMAVIPKDRYGAMPEPERIFGSLPTTDFNSITIPGLGADLNASYAAWKDGSLERTPTTSATVKAWIFLLSAVGMGLLLAFLTHRYLHRQKTELFQRNPYR